MDKETLQQLIEEDTEGLLSLEIEGVYRIYGRIKGQRGGCYFGFDEEGKPIFGGSNLIYAPTWWEHTLTEVTEVCKLIMEKYPNCEARPFRKGKEEESN
jgi:hypothetical protein